MDDAIKRMDNLVMFLGKMVTEIQKDIKLLRNVEDTFDMNPKDIKKIRTALKTASAFYVKKQEVAALQIEQMKDE